MSKKSRFAVNMYMVIIAKARICFDSHIFSDVIWTQILNDKQGLQCKFSGRHINFVKLYLVDYLICLPCKQKLVFKVILILCALILTSTKIAKLLQFPEMSINLFPLCEAKKTLTTISKNRLSSRENILLQKRQ